VTLSKLDDPLSDVRARFDGWINYGRFTQGIVVVGGGIDVQAGGVLDNLIVALATAGIVDGGNIQGASRTMQIDNGGTFTSFPAAG
jgi:filamentous hemagglutinin